VVKSGKESSSMVVNGDVISLNKTEVLKLVEGECKKRLNITAAQFIRLQENKQLPNNLAVHDIEMMLRLAK
jgi:hypothetical protein